ncbi:hypothetical protein ACQRAL_11685 [Lachnospiraceae bacterium SGI.231]
MMSAINGKNELQDMSQTTALQFASFENAKKQLRTFSNRNSGDFGIDKVEVDGGFLWLGDHKVTGSELNKVTSQVQDYLIKINGFSKDVVKEIGYVYDALESLDKEYIPAILTAVKGAEIASNQAKGASEHARIAQEDIKKTIEKQKKIVGVLEKHKEKLDKLVHLENIDDIWKQSKELEKEMSDFQKSFMEAKEQLSNFEKSIKALQSFANSILDYEHLEEIDDMWERLGFAEANIDSNLTSISEVNRKIEEIFQISHINDLDYMWEELENRKNEVEGLNTKIQEQEEKVMSAEQNIHLLLELKKNIDSLKHVTDIDTSWADIQKAKENISSSADKISLAERDISNLSEVVSELNVFKQELLGISHLYEIDNMNETLILANQKIEKLELENKNQLERIRKMKSEFESEVNQNNENSLILKSKIKLAYIIAGSAVGLTIFQLILSIVGVL